jgi:hypothetical protein
MGATTGTGPSGTRDIGSNRELGDLSQPGSLQPGATEPGGSDIRSEETVPNRDDRVPGGAGPMGSSVDEPATGGSGTDSPFGAGDTGTTEQSGSGTLDQSGTGGSGKVDGGMGKMDGGVRDGGM